MEPKKAGKWGESWRDRLGIALSVVCMFHCLLTPLVLLGVPFLSHQGREFLASDAWHQIFLLIVPLVALLAFLPGWKRHRDVRVWWLSAWGLFFLLAGVGIGLTGEGHVHLHADGIESAGQFWLSLTSPELHELPAYFEIALTMIGGALFIRAHLLNRHLIGCGVGPHGGDGCNHRHHRLELAPKMG